jgi:hypothetical protein
MGKRWTVVLCAWSAHCQGSTQTTNFKERIGATLYARQMNRTIRSSAKMFAMQPQEFGYYKTVQFKMREPK